MNKFLTLAATSLAAIANASCGAGNTPQYYIYHV